MAEFGASSKGYGALWDSCKTIATEVEPAKHIAAMILKRIPTQYEPLEKTTGVPAFWTGCIDKRESDMNPARNIAQGDRWDRVSTHVPKGMGPFTSWSEAATAAYKLPAHKLDKVQRWSVERMLYEAEKWNGFGYLRHGTNSPYVWGWTNHQQPGKYIADGVWSSTAWDSQPGVAAMLQALAASDPAIAERLKDREAKPPPEVKAHETKPGRTTAGAGAGGAAGTAGQKAATEHPHKTVIHYMLEYTAFAFFGIVIVAGVVMVIRKAKLLKDKWG
jgi:lysozyme family protein